MYRIMLGNEVIYDPRIPECYLGDPVLHEKANKIGTLKFTIHPMHAQYGQLDKLASILSVYKEDRTLPMWRGRVLSTKRNKDNSIEVECEDLLAFLFDSVIRPFDFKGSVSEMLEYVLTQHNEQVTATQQIQLGTVTVTDPNDYIHRSSTDYLSSWEVIESKLIKLLGGYLRLRHTANGMYLDYLEGTQSDLPTSTQVIEYGENLTDLTEEVDAGETYTVCLPLGAKITLEDDTGEEIQRRLTVESVNNGADYIVNETARAQYGWICAPVKETTWDDVTVPANLLKKAQEYLNNQAVKLRNTLKLTAVDLHHRDSDVESFEFLEFVIVKSTPHKIEKTYLLTEKKTPLSNPKGTEITLGDTELSLSDTTLSGFKDAIERVEIVSGTVDLNDAMTNAQFDEIAQTTIELRSDMERTAQALISQMSESYISSSSFEEFQRDISTKFTQTATDFTFEFDELVKQISKVNGDTNQQFSEISKYIRFEDGNIILGRSDSALTLKIQSDRISFILDNVEIAYFSSGRLYVDNLEAITTLTVGNFAWIPRSNGNLSLKMINPAAHQAMAVWNGATTMAWEE